MFRKDFQGIMNSHRGQGAPSERTSQRTQGINSVFSPQPRHEKAKALLLGSRMPHIHHHIRLGSMPLQTFRHRIVPWTYLWKQRPNAAMDLPSPGDMDLRHPLFVSCICLLFFPCFCSIRHSDADICFPNGRFGGPDQAYADLS